MAAEHTSEEKSHFARSMHKLHGGALHRHLGIPEDQPIPMEKKQAAANSDNPHVAAMGRMAVAMHGWKHKGKALKSYHTGGVVTEDGPANLQKGEKVTPANKPADLAAAQATPGTSTSTGGATATRNTGAATGGAVTVTISGSSSTDTATTTGAGAGKGAAGKGKDASKNQPPVNITINSTGTSGNAVDGAEKK